MVAKTNSGKCNLKLLLNSDKLFFKKIKFRNKKLSLFYGDHFIYIIIKNNFKIKLIVIINKLNHFFQFN